MTDYEKVVELVFGKKASGEYKVSGYEIAKQTGIDASLISKLRLGQREVDGITIRTGKKFAKCYNLLAYNGEI